MKCLIFVATIVVVVSASPERQRRSVGWSWGHNGAVVLGTLRNSIAVAGPVAPAATVVAPISPSVAVVGPAAGSAAVIEPIGGHTAVVGPSAGLAAIVGPIASSATVVQWSSCRISGNCRRCCSSSVAAGHAGSVVAPVVTNGLVVKSIW
ncbi:hypothetical protein DMN91_003007 [Ooceraea biroi]|uniref:Uncharacterized protein n=1 Tax=Ooceraea biroi TaxID=2015173 RepID=A0A3L8DX14_OOCBI|nr:uncharacterized protein LOC105275438 [Ooceraea biroi]RLU24916.1 hypothetical protein DMN91_003007 [Ooceraea biroi]